MSTKTKAELETENMSLRQQMLGIQAEAEQSAELHAQFRARLEELQGKSEEDEKHRLALIAQLAEGEKIADKLAADMKQQAEQIEERDQLIAKLKADIDRERGNPEPALFNADGSWRRSRNPTRGRTIDRSPPPSPESTRRRREPPPDEPTTRRRGERQPGIDPLLLQLTDEELRALAASGHAGAAALIRTRAATEEVTSDAVDQE
ncbi:MAG: hypothetical protein OEZ01_00540 [Candidatus Heimdallarchaeota archaeon]|nr:hypothetical protein [Candidatus Heimdallarchaeota archaeon]MDH5676618.1 hypothetical protein [Myxococcales bacterium]